MINWPMKLITIVILILTFSSLKLLAEGEFERFKKEVELKTDEKLITVFYQKNNCISCFAEIVDALSYLEKEKIIDDKNIKILFIVFEERKKIYDQTVKNLKLSGKFMQGTQMNQKNLGIKLEEFLVVFDYEGKILYRYKYKGKLKQDLVKLLQ